MKSIFLLFCITFCINSRAEQAQSSDRLQEVINSHYSTIEHIDQSDASVFMSLLIGLAARGRLTDEMINYFSKDIDASYHFYQAYKFAESFSKEVCGIGENQKRRVDDEVDAVRHFIWSSYLAYNLDEKRAREIMSLQENRMDNLDLASEMDLYNNERGIEFALELKDKRRTRRGRRLHKYNKKTIKSAILEHLNRQMLLILESKPSRCQT